MQLKENGEYRVIGVVDALTNPDGPELYTYSLPELSNGIHTFRVHMTSTEGGSTYSDELDVIVSKNDYFLEPPFPNPVSASGHATLHFWVKNQQTVHLTAYDITGRQVKILYSGVPEANVVQTATISTSTLAAGVYIFRLEGETFGTTQTLFIQK